MSATVDAQRREESREQRMHRGKVRLLKQAVIHSAWYDGRPQTEIAQRLADMYGQPVTREWVRWIQKDVLLLEPKENQWTPRCPTCGGAKHE
jgi:hypothetical protein